MKMKNIALLLIVMIAFASCSSDDEKAADLVVSVKHSQNWDGQNVTGDDFGTTEFTNENGDVLKFQKLRYLISKVILTNTFGETVELGDYNLADLADDNTLSFANNIVIPPGTYNSISFVYGFNEEDNVDQAYADLNTASWNWPGMLGGGYHFMQFEGTFTNSTTVNPLPFAYHNGTARVSDGVFEQNFITVTVDGLSIDSNATIDIKMNLAEWFKNPNTWNLNELSIDLMMNYEAQIDMNENGQSVFTVSVEE